MDPFTMLAVGGAVTGGLSSLANFGLGLANYNYQKDLQNKMFRREDTSIARRVHDLKASGLSPVLAAGQGASAGPVVSTRAPEINGLNQIPENIINLMSMEKDFAVKDEQIKLLKTQQGLNNVNRKIKDLDYYYYDETGVSPNSSAFGKAFRDVVSIYSKFKGMDNNIIPYFPNKKLNNPPKNFKEKNLPWNN